MRLFGKYNFETLRDCLQGVFEFYTTSDKEHTYYILELWQLRLVIYPASKKPNGITEDGFVQFLINGGSSGYKSFGKISLTYLD